jgi:hypothetical protein
MADRFVTVIAEDLAQDDEIFAPQNGRRTKIAGKYAGWQPYDTSEYDEYDEYDAESGARLIVLFLDGAASSPVVLTPQSKVRLVIPCSGL